MKAIIAVPLVDDVRRVEAGSAQGAALIKAIEDYIWLGRGARRNWGGY